MDQEWGSPGKVASPPSHPTLGSLGRNLNPNMAPCKPQKCRDCPKPPGEFGEGTHGGVQSTTSVAHAWPWGFHALPPYSGGPILAISQFRHLIVTFSWEEFLGFGILGVQFWSGTALSGFSLPVVASQLSLTPWGCWDFPPGDKYSNFTIIIRTILTKVMVCTWKCGLNSGAAYV